MALQPSNDIESNKTGGNITVELYIVEEGVENETTTGVDVEDQEGYFGFYWYIVEKVAQGVLIVLCVVGMVSNPLIFLTVRRILAHQKSSNTSGMRLVALGLISLS